MKKILLIEDEERLRNNTAEILEISGFEVETAENGKVGVEKAILNKPDLVVCDVMMPVLDGYGVLQAFTHNDLLMGVPFIFLTAKVERSDLRKGMELGADDYLTKPFGINELMSAINTRLQKIENLKRTLTTDESLGQFLDNAKINAGINSLSVDRKVHLFKKKKVIYSEGDMPTKLFFIKSGKVKIVRENSDGKELITTLCGAGDFFGYNALIENKIYTDTALALEECEILYIPQTDFFDLLFRNADVAQSFVKMLSNQILEKEHQLLGLAYNSLRKRVAEGIIQYVKRYKVDYQDKVIVSITREDLSNIAGTAMESLVRTLGDFKDEGLIDIVEGKVVVSNVEKLERLKY
jgi:CRP-like cAMP-binding protein/CheY-like chemotaxis protein